MRRDPNGDRVRRNAPAINERMRWIDGALRWEGGFNRCEAAVRFSVSEAQVSADVAAYSAAGAGYAFYDHRTRRFRPGANHVQVHGVGLSEWLRLRGAADGQPGQADRAGADDPLPAAEPELAEDAVRAILASLRRRHPCDVDFYSAARSAAQRSVLHPHSLFADGPNWHVRGWDGLRRRFVDLCLAHVLEAHEAGGAAGWIPPEADEGWQVSVRLALVPSPALPPGRRFLVAREYGMREERLVLTVRRALVWRILAREGILRALAAGQPWADGAALWPEDPEAARHWAADHQAG